MRTDEDLGLLNRTYTITAVVTGNVLGEYDLRKNSLITALEESGIGVFIHPFDGLRRVVAKTYTLAESEQHLNEAIFNITFSESTENTSPSPQSGSTAEIFSLAAEALVALEADTASSYRVNLRSVPNANDAQNKVTAIAQTFTTETSRFSSDPEFINEFSGTLVQYISDTAVNAFSGVNIANKTVELFTQADDLPTNGTDAISFFQKFYGFGDDDTEIEETTVVRAQRRKNRGVVNAMIQSAALVLSYQNAALLTFDTEDQINDLVQTLDTQYFKILKNEYLGDLSEKTLTDLKTKMADFFRQADTTAARTNDVQTNQVPVSVLTYQYYGDLDRVDDIVALNGFQDVSFITGDVEVLTR
jgi:prophage DNA circulation protein